MCPELVLEPSPCDTQLALQPLCPQQGFIPRKLPEQVTSRPGAAAPVKGQRVCVFFSAVSGVTAELCRPSRRVPEPHVPHMSGRGAC